MRRLDSTERIGVIFSFSSLLLLLLILLILNADVWVNIVNERCNLGDILCGLHSQHDVSETISVTIFIIMLRRSYRCSFDCSSSNSMPQFLSVVSISRSNASLADLSLRNQPNRVFLVGFSRFDIVALIDGISALLRSFNWPSIFRTLAFRRTGPRNTDDASLSTRISLSYLFTFQFAHFIFYV